MMNIQIREAKEVDIPQILEIINYEIKHTTNVYDYTERTIEEQKKWFVEKRENNFPVIVAEKEGIVIGYGSYGIFRPWEAYRLSLEHSIYLRKEIRGLGIGKKLMETLITYAKTENYHTMVAGIDSTNMGSIQFHKSFGFKEIGVFKDIGYKFDRWLDLTMMQLILKE